MSRCVMMLVATVVSCVISGTSVRAGGDAAAEAILDRAIKAMGGAEKLGKIEAFTWTASASIKMNRRVSDSVFVVTFKGLDHARRDFRTRSPLPCDHRWRQGLVYVSGPLPAD